MIVEHRLAPLLLTLAAAACAGRGNSSARQPGEYDGGDSSVATQAGGDASSATPSGAAPPYVLAPVDGEGRVVESGTVEVAVEWPDPKPALLGSPGLNDCGVPMAPAVSVHTLHGVRDTVVALADVPRGRAPSPPATVELAVRDCRVVPPVTVAPRLGAALAVINDDERPHEVVLEYVGASGPEPLARLPMPLVGQRFEVALDRPGIVRARPVGEKVEAAYVYVPAHPYVGLTTDKGRVEIPEVVPGAYRIAVWHAPLTSGGEPLTAAAEVTVTAGKKSELTVSLAR